MSTRSKQNQKQLEKQMDAQAGEHIGSIVMWTISDVAIEVGNLKALFSQHGLDWDEWGPIDLSPEVTFTKAVQEARKATEGYRFVTLFDGREKKTMGIVAEKVDEASEDVQYETDWTTGGACKATLDKVNNSVTLSNPKHPAGRIVKQKFDELGATYTMTDFVKLLTRNVRHKMAGIVLRSHGGAYFVPSAYYGLLKQHKAIVEGVSEATEFFCANVKDDKSSKADLGRKASRSLGEELQEIEAQLQAWTEKPPRPDTIVRHIESYVELRGKAEMYASMLNIKATDIMQGLKLCEQQAKALIGVAEKADEGRREARVARGKKLGAKRSAEAAKRREAEEKAAEVPMVRKVEEKKTSKPIKQAMKEAAAKRDAEEKAEKKAVKKAAAPVKATKKAAVVKKAS